MSSIFVLNPGRLADSVMEGGPEQPSVSTLRVGKPGKPRFAPVAAGGARRKQQTSTPAFSVPESTTTIPNPTKSFLDEGPSVASTLTSTQALISSLQQHQPPPLRTKNHAALLEDDVDPPKEQGGDGKRTMAYYLRHRTTEGIPMRNSTANNEVVKRVRHGRRSNSSLPLLEQQAQSLTTMIAPQVRLVDGRIVVDEQAALMTDTAPTDASVLTVVHESASNRHYTSATYSRYSGSNRWSAVDTELFYDALRMCGTDFAMVATLFPGRSRAQIKGKFKIEERNNPEAITRALSKPIPFDPTFDGRVSIPLSVSPADNSNKT